MQVMQIHLKLNPQTESLKTIMNPNHFQKKKETVRYFSICFIKLGIRLMVII